MQPSPRKRWTRGELLIASHILPWADHEAERLNVRNGIALNRLFEAAFDRRFLSFDDDLKLIFLPPLTPFLKDPATADAFAAFEGKSLHVPADGAPPNPAFLAMHRGDTVCGVA